MKVCAVIVAYRTDTGYLHRLLGRLHAMFVDEVVLVDNHPDRLMEPATLLQYHPRVRLLSQHYNTGSSGGFKRGIVAARETAADFFWLLDEDNYPQDAALETLLQTWQERALHLESKPQMLLSFRPQLFRFLNPYLIGEELQITPHKNSFLGFHYRRFHQIIINRIKRVNGQLSLLIRKGEPLPINAGYYGGLFFHRRVISDYLLPDEGMFLYWDDIAFTQRFIEEGGEVWLIPHSRITDMDYEETRQLKKRFLHHPVLDLDTDLKAYYYIRNLSWYSEQRLKAKRLPYRLNQGMMLSLLIAMAVLRGKPGRLLLFIRAWRDAWHVQPVTTYSPAIAYKTKPNEVRSVEHSY